MTIISLTDCCHLLAVDPKTLRHWMRLSHLEARKTPLDARRKYLTREQLQQLAAAHHRTLETKAMPHLQREASLPPIPTHEVSATVFSDVREKQGATLLSMIMHILGLLLKGLMGRRIISKSVISPDFSAPLTSLTEQLATLQAHVVTLQHQLRLLTDQLQNEQQWRASVALTPETKSQESSLDLSLEKPQEPSLDLFPEKSGELSLESSLVQSWEKSQEPSQESSPDLSPEKSGELSLESSLDLSPEKSQEPSREKKQARVAANALSIDERRRSHVLPWVEYGTGGKYVVICPERGLLEFSPDSPEWFAWLSTLSSFRFTGKLGRFTAHRGGSTSASRSWRASRHIRNRSYNQSLGKTESLTIVNLEQVAATLQSHLN